jgi:hypothetical protein
VQYLIWAFSLHARFLSRVERVWAYVVRVDLLLFDSDLTESKIGEGKRADESALESIFCIVR